MQRTANQTQPVRLIGGKPAAWHTANNSDSDNMRWEFSPNDLQALDAPNLMARGSVSVYSWDTDNGPIGIFSTSCSRGGAR